MSGVTRTKGERPYRRDRKGFEEWIVPIDPIHNALVSSEEIANKLADLLDRDFDGVERDLVEALKTMVDKCEPLVGDLSWETSPHSYIPCMADVLLCIKQAVEDAEAAIAKAEGK